MTRTEDDLRTMYCAESTLASERNITNWLRHELAADPGYRRGHRTKWTAPLSAAAGVAAVTVAVVAVTAHGQSGPGHATAGGPASAPATVADRPQVKGSAGASTAPSQTEVPLTAQVAQQTLLDLLPRHGRVTNRAGAADAEQALTELTFDDGHGAAALDLNVIFATNDNGNSWPCASANHAGTCSTLPDGTQLFTLQTYEFPDRRVDTLLWTVSVLRPDGMQIDISEWNAPTEKDTPTSRPAPPFTTAQLTTVATSPAWTAKVSVATAQKDAALFVPDDRLSPAPAAPGAVSAARSRAAAARAAASAHASTTKHRSPTR